MRKRNRAREALRRLRRHIQLGLMYAGAGAWSDPKVYDALREEVHRKPNEAPDQVTPYAELPYRERRFFQELEEQMRQEKGT